VCIPCRVNDIDGIADTRSHRDCSRCCDKGSTAPPPAAFRAGCVLFDASPHPVPILSPTIGGCSVSRWFSVSCSPWARLPRRRLQRSRGGHGPSAVHIRFFGRSSPPQPSIRPGTAESTSPQPARCMHQRLEWCISPDSWSIGMCSRSRIPGACFRASSPSIRCAPPVRRSRAGS
jgi:hypothetical protein